MNYEEEKLEDKIPDKKFKRQRRNQIKYTKKEKTYPRKIKIDQAFKPFLRGIRRCLNSLYKLSSKNANDATHYHWTDEKIYSYVKDYLEIALFNGTESFSDKDVWKMVAMLHPTKATIKSSKKGRKDMPTC